VLAEFRVARVLFLRALGAIHFFAFASFLAQANGLIGENGILPLAPFLDLVEKRLGPDRLHVFPTLFWWTGGSDAAIHALSWLGIGLSILLMLGLFEHLALVALWALYLSISTAARTFFSFQWDILLLELTLSSLFLPAARLLPGFLTKRSSVPPARAAIVLLWILLFKLVFSSGVAKLNSGDHEWRNLTALLYHYETQPLPTWIGWYAHQLPVGFQKFSVAAMFFIQLVVPFFFFVPWPPIRHIGAALTAFLQILIALTGNYCFFNLIALALCLLLVDDAFFARVFGARFVDRFTLGPPPLRRRALEPWSIGARAIAMLPILILDGLILLRTVAGSDQMSERGEELLTLASPLRSVNGYGLFAVMTTSRKEIVVEGSDDGVRWVPYEFEYKPGDVLRRPEFVAPHQPRLDWQMWFAALGTPRQNGWFTAFARRILEGSADVLALLATNPFPDHPPRYVRGKFYDYHFTTFEERAASGAWWKRADEGEWFPPRSLADFSPAGR
jgi:hypothetical protein